MADIKTQYMGLELDNPIIVGACKLTANIDKIKELQAAGAGAIVCASLFEEQIQLEQMLMDQTMEDINDRDPEMARLFPTEFESNGPKEHQKWVRQAKQAVSIPVIASLNAVSPLTWLDYSKLLEDTGVDGLELNFFHTPDEAQRSGADIEKEQIDILQAVKEKVSIPVAAKLSFFYSNPLHVVTQMDQTKVDAFVLFNRLFDSDIDIKSEFHTKPFNLSAACDYKLPLRYIGLLYEQINADLCANTGILSGFDIAKALLTGADSVQIVSALYQNDNRYIRQMLDQLTQWMDQKGYKSLADFRGKLSNAKIRDPFVYRRAQYAELILNSERLQSPHFA